MRSMWSGSISFGLVTIPVQLFPAARAKQISFHQLHEADQSRIKYAKICATENKEVPDEEIVRGFEYSKGRLVVLTDDELAGADPKMTRSIDILDIVDGAEIDPIYFLKPYLLGPRPGGEKAYLLLVKTLDQAGRVAIGQCVMHAKQYLVAIRPKDEILVMETMHYPDELASAEEIKASLAAAEVTDKELELARSLVEHMSGAFEPDKFRDVYREKILEMVEKKVEGRAVVAPEAPPSAVPVVDLVGALKSSLKDLKKAG